MVEKPKRNLVVTMQHLAMKQAIFSYLTFKWALVLLCLLVFLIRGHFRIGPEASENKTKVICTSSSISRPLKLISFPEAIGTKLEISRIGLSILAPFFVGSISAVSCLRPNSGWWSSLRFSFSRLFFESVCYYTVYIIPLDNCSSASFRKLVTT